MALRGVHGAPYQLALGVAMWATLQRRYLNGRLILAGHDPAMLGLRAMLDVTEAVMIEPVLHGGHTSVDEILGQLHAALLDARPDRDTWGTLPHHVEAAQAAEDLFSATPPGG